MNTSFYAFAQNPKSGKIEQMFTERVNGKFIDRWTGVVYKSIKAASADVQRLNIEQEAKIKAARGIALDA